MNKIELCSRNVSAAMREVLNAGNAVDPLDFPSDKQAREDALQVSGLLEESALTLQKAQDILAKYQTRR